MFFLKTCLTFASLKLNIPAGAYSRILTHPGFLKQRMQSRHFQYFNVIIKKKKTHQILCVWADACTSGNVVGFGHMDGWLVAAVTWSRNTKGLFSSRMCVWGGALWGSGSLLMYVLGRGGAWQLNPEPAAVGCSRFPPGLRVSACQLPPRTGTWKQADTRASEGCGRGTHLPGGALFVA